MNTVPEPILQSAKWPWWRRQLDRPPRAVRMRTASWLALQELLNCKMRGPVPEWPETERSGIFDASMTRVERLDAYSQHAPLKLNGRVLDDKSTPPGASEGFLRRVDLICPFGRLTTLVNFKSFEFDITEVDAIGASQSDARYFASVYEFGQDFAEYKKAPMNMMGLSKMLVNDQVRIFRPNSCDSVGLRLWDGRLFLYNAGGSHHFAAASFIAKNIGAKVPINASLEVRALNVPAVHWLLSNFIPLAVPKRDSVGLLLASARLLGACYEMDVPDRVCINTTLLLVPSNREATVSVVSAFADSGFHSIKPWFESLLALQAKHRGECVRRFGERVKFTDDSTDATSSPARL